MKKRLFIYALLASFIAGQGFSQTPDNEVRINAPEAPQENRRPEGYDPAANRYSNSLHELSERYSEEVIRKGQNKYSQVKQVNKNGKYKATGESIDTHQTPEWFEDAKFGMFIDWGLWSVAGWAPKHETAAMYPDWYELWMESDKTVREYHIKNWGEDFKRDDFIPLFKAAKYDPERIVQTAKEAGMKYIVPFTKHHSGFCLWPSSYTLRDTEDMGPRRDLMGPLAEACAKESVKFGFYFSLDEWDYPIIDHDTLRNRRWGGKLVPHTPDMEWKATGKVAVNDFFNEYIVPQAAEFIDKYDPDLVWYDGDWDIHMEKTNVTNDIAAYFYNNAEGRKEVAINDRFGKDGGKSLWLTRGDFYCSEFMQKDKEVKEGTHPWEKCRGISQSFGYNWQDTEDNVITSKQFIDMFVDIVSMGGNLLLLVNLDQDGKIPAQEEDRLKTIGKWLEVNGEGIYATRRYTVPAEGSVSYTISKDGKTLYAIMKEWPGEKITLHNAAPVSKAKIKLLGYGKSLKWEKTAEGIAIEMPEKLRDESKRPGEHAWTLSIPLL